MTNGSDPTLSTDSATQGSSAYRPIIGVTPRWELQEPSLRLPEQLPPEQAMACVFTNALIAAGALPFMMSMTTNEELIDSYLDMMDGLAIPGGQDVDPKLWGDTRPYDQSLLCHERDRLEMTVIKKALERDMPIFATCRGEQILNVALGGSLCMDISSYPVREGMATWRHTTVLTNPVHPVEIKKDTLLYRCTQQELVQVNSAHHCCVDRLGDGVVLSAVATDGMPEAIEYPEKKFVLGVQWHPEYTWRAIRSDYALWKSFVNAAREFHNQK